MNVVLATVVCVIAVALIRFRPDTNPEVLGALTNAVFFNFILFFFNLIPANPLDGGSVARGLIPESWVDAWDEYSVYAPFVLLAILMIPKIQIIFVRPARECTIWLFEALARLFGA